MAFKKQSPASRRDALRDAAIYGTRLSVQTPATTGEPAPPVFVSYAREDLLTVTELVGALRARGIGVVWDQDFPSRSLSSLIKKTIAEAACVIAVWSAASCKSHWVEGEAARAHKLGKLVSAHVDGFDVDDLALQFSGLNCVPVADMTRIFDSLAQHGIAPL